MSETLDYQSKIAKNIALLLETEKCTVEESSIILRMVTDIINGSIFTVHK
jgi:hypothetical protein